MSFSFAIDRVLEHEGGYVNDPADPGGETNFGISKRAYPNLDIAKLTVADARAIYRSDYWNELGLDELTTSPEVKGSVFDMAVNAGPDRATKLLQRACNAFLVDTIGEDGQLGPATRAAVKSLRPDRLLKAYTSIRGDYYMTLGLQKPPLKRFVGGWLNRAFGWLP